MKFVPGLLRQRRRGRQRRRPLHRLSRAKTCWAMTEGGTGGGGRGGRRPGRTDPPFRRGGRRRGRRRTEEGRIVAVWRKQQPPPQAATAEAAVGELLQPEMAKIWRSWEQGELMLLHLRYFSPKEVHAGMTFFAHIFFSVSIWMVESAPGRRGHWRRRKKGIGQRRRRPVRQCWRSSKLMFHSKFLKLPHCQVFFINAGRRM